MCTLSVVSLVSASVGSRAPTHWVRVAMNRDEQLSRPAALQPRQRKCSVGRALMPIDPVSGGTWVAANDRGLSLAVLNVNPRGQCGLSTDTGQSRGRIIPNCLSSAGTLSEALAWGAATDFTDYAPFRLVLTDRTAVASLRWNGRRLRIRKPFSHRRPVMFTSSGLGDRLVDRPRRALFEQMFKAAPSGELISLQDSFHRHHWPNHPELSVCMTRSDAATVNHTIVELWPEAASLSFWPTAPSGATVPAACCRLARRDCR